MSDPAGTTSGASRAWEWLVAGGLSVIAALVAAWRWATRSIVVEVLSEAMRAHNGDETAHVKATREAAERIEERLEQIEKFQASNSRKLDRLYVEHRMICARREAAPPLHELRLTIPEEPGG